MRKSPKMYSSWGIFTALLLPLVLLGCSDSPSPSVEADAATLDAAADDAAGNAACGGKCVAGDDDCDGLPDAVDPERDRCNPLERTIPLDDPLEHWTGTFSGAAPPLDVGEGVMRYQDPLAMTDRALLVRFASSATAVAWLLQVTLTNTDGPRACEVTKGKLTAVSGTRTGQFAVLPATTWDTGLFFLLVDLSDSPRVRCILGRESDNRFIATASMGHESTPSTDLSLSIMSTNATTKLHGVAVYRMK